MSTVSNHNLSVNPNTPSTPILIRAFQDWLLASGTDPAVARTRTAWVERFRRFRARPGNPRPLGEDLQQFGEVIRTQRHTPEDQVRVALSAIHCHNRASWRLEVQDGRAA